MKKTPTMKGNFMTDAALFVLRLSGLGLALAHGWPKIERLLSGQGAPFIEGVANLGFPYPTVFAWAATLARDAGATHELRRWLDESGYRDAVTEDILRLRGGG